ncbi:MAG: 1-deoxy-D-xylulose-5-phosphate synthase [Ruminococcaceae bacterium]|jgi:1-deoxy-D-xylulose-5-phosphate synthase|nr:1-deoxy-D-xylulose-5-phosphate synthase [Oscillospiraceae bacterium]
MKLLDTIHSREDLLRIPPDQEAQLCAEIREYLVQCVSKNGGHLSSNLGIVELTVAIEKEFDTSRDRLLFDVGHQCYVHKLLTGRREALSELRTYGGIAGFPKPCESESDAFTAGHASSAVSIALGMARARTLSKEDYHVIALLGDGALTGGLSYEGLNDAGASSEPLIVILNDNAMSITPNVGGIASYLNLIRTKPGYFKLKRIWRKFALGAPGGMFIYKIVHRLKESFKRHTLGINFFEEMGFQYMGPVSGHDITRLIYMLRRAKEMHCPVLLHVLTQKGKGYLPAEQNPDVFHGVGRFDPETGEVQKGGPTFCDAFGEELVRLAAHDRRICAVTAAMRQGNSLDAFAETYPDRFFDVGIAEGHAVSMAGGLAKQGLIPVVAIYSTFLQRAFDMMMQDVALLHLHVVFAVDRAGLVGPDGETHHGEFDVGYLRQIPGMTVLCPSNRLELRKMLSRAIYDCTGPVAVRYPRGEDGVYRQSLGQPVLREGKDLTIVSYGIMINEAIAAADLLSGNNLRAEIIKLDRICPLDMGPVEASAKKTGAVFVIEDCARQGSLSQELFSALASGGFDGKCAARNLGDVFVSHGSRDELLRERGLDAHSLADWITEVLANG